MEVTDVRSKFKDVAKVILPDSVAEHCASICSVVGVDADTLANEWEAFAINRNYTEIDLPRLDKLKDMLMKKLKKKSAVTKHHSSARPVMHSSLNNKRVLTGQFNSPTLKKAKMSSLSPVATNSPICNTAGYNERTNMGKVEAALNDDLNINKPAESVSVQLLGGEECNAMEPYLYMHSTLDERGVQLDAIITQVKSKLMEQYDLKEFASVGHQSQEPVVICGRICCEAAEGKMNASSILLEGGLEDSGCRVKVDLSNSSLTEYALFPGQIVAIQGMCTSGHTIVADKIYSDVTPSSFEQTGRAKEGEGGEESISVMVCSGPYSTVSSLGFDPLEDLLAVVRDEEPHLLVLMGPFVDINHPMIASGKPVVHLPGENGTESVTLTFQDIYDLVLSRVSVGLEDTKTKAVLIPSLDDALHHVVFPQPPLPKPSSGLEHEDKVTFLPNPCTFRVNNTVFGVCTNDVLFDLSKEAVIKVDKKKKVEGPVRKSRVERLVELVLQQRSYYPLFPPAVDAKVDIMQNEKFRIPFKPQVLLTPSRLSHFCKQVGDTVCMNPGRLTRGRTGGLFAKLSINSTTDESSKAKTVKAQIVRI